MWKRIFLFMYFLLYDAHCATLQGFGEVEGCYIVPDKSIPNCPQTLKDDVCLGRQFCGIHYCYVPSLGCNVRIAVEGVVSYDPTLEFGEIHERVAAIEEGGIGTSFEDTGGAYVYCRMIYPYLGHYVGVTLYPEVYAREYANACGYLYMGEGEYSSSCYQVLPSSYDRIDDSCEDDYTYMHLYSSVEEENLLFANLFEKAELLCDIGISRLMVSTGQSFKLYAEKYTEPSLVVQYNDQKCYAKLESGSATGAININYNGMVYHTTVASSGGSSGEDTGGDSGEDTGGEEEVFNDYKFTVITTDDTSEFTFYINYACGKYFVDWGDGTEEIIDNEDCSVVQCSHSYATSGTYTIKLGGQATKYRDPDSVLNLQESLGYIAAIDGCLGCVFPTLADGAQPNFQYMFAGAKFTSIPETLFNGITNQGQYAADVAYMFRGTFASAKITSIPEKLFAGITGPTSFGMFAETFYNTPITSIPENLFAGLDTSEPLAPEAFMATFGECDSLTGPSAQINGQYLYEIWPDATYDQVGGMYYGATGLDDYDNIPSDWK